MVLGMHIYYKTETYCVKILGINVWTEGFIMLVLGIKLCIHIWTNVFCYKHDFRSINSKLNIIQRAWLFKLAEHISLMS